MPVLLLSLQEEEDGKLLKNIFLQNGFLGPGGATKCILMKISKMGA
jgi:hypothetical protein